MSEETKHKLEGLAYILYPVLIILGIALAGFASVKWYYSAGKGSLYGLQFSELQPWDVNQDPSLLVGKYMDAIGGQDAWSEHRNYIYEGVVIEAGVFRVFRACGDGWDNLVCEFLDNGSRYHLQFVDGDLRVEDASGDSAVWDDSLEVIADTMLGVFDPMVDFSVNGRGDILNVEHSDWSGFPALKVCFIRNDRGLISEVYLRESDLKLLARVDLTKSGEKHVFRFSRFEQVNGLRMPYDVQVDFNEGRSSIVRFRKIDPVLGGGDFTQMLSSVFAE
ncbi:MAG: hypothetical protein ACSHX4_00515 [Opitutaceae bacterium]